MFPKILNDESKASKILEINIFFRIDIRKKEIKLSFLVKNLLLLFIISVQLQKINRDTKKINKNNINICFLFSSSV